MGKYHQHRRWLTNINISVRLRLKLFDAVVTEKNEVVSIPAVVEETKEQSTDQRQRTNL